MTLATPLKDLTHSVWNRRIVGNEVPKQTTGTDIFLTAGVTIFGQTGIDIDLCAEDEPLSGIVVGRSDDATDLDADSDDCYAADVNVNMGIPIPGEEVYLTSITNEDIAIGVIVQCDGGFFETNDFAAGSTSANVPYAASMMLQCLETVTGASGVEAIFLAKRV